MNVLVIFYYNIFIKLILVMWLVTFYACSCSFHSGIDSIEMKKVDVGVQFNYASLETGRFNNYIIN